MAEENRGPQTTQLHQEPGKRLPPLHSRLWTRTGLADKTLWDLLQLLVVPLALAAIGFWFTAHQDARQQKIAARQAEVDREIEAQRADEAMLQAYLDQMGTLLLDRNLRAADKNSDVRRLARARTLVVLDAVDPARQERVLRFLHEAGLIEATPPKNPPVISLKYAHLENIDLPHRILLRGTDLQQADLSGANLARIDLRDAYLAGAHLEGANLEGTDLSGAFLKGANLSDANLAGADLSNAEELWERGTYMWKRGAGLSHADLSGANLKGTDLSRANLSGAKGITKEQLGQAKSLQGTTMPNGQKYEEWLKSRGEAG
jgi:uncharacterized protein YjbI with pentapeptide repeats